MKRGRDRPKTLGEEIKLLLNKNHNHLVINFNIINNNNSMINMIKRRAY